MSTNLVYRAEDFVERLKAFETRFTNASERQQRKLTLKLRALEREWAAFERRKDYGSPLLN